MRIAIVCVPAGEPERLARLAEAMARALDKTGFFVDIHGPETGEAPRLTGYDYIVVGSEAAGPGGKLPARVAELLAQSGAVSGKRSMAFVRKTAFGSGRALSRLMAAMEAEGMRVNCAEIVSDAAGAAEAVRGAPLERA